MLFLLLIFALCTMSFMVIFWVVTLFLQGYYYTEPTEGIAWQAPAAGGAMALFISFWCMLIVNSSDVRPGDIPYDTLVRFSPKVFKSNEPIKELWAIGKSNKDPVLFRIKKDIRPPAPATWHYENTVTHRPWSEGDTSEIQIKSNNETVRLRPLPYVSGQGYQEFADDSGWIMRVYGQDGPTGMLYAFRWGRFIANLFLNFFLLALWFICYWLLLRFYWGHALGLAVVSWLIMQLTVLPLILEQAGNRALGR